MKHRKIDNSFLSFCNPIKVGECCYKTISTIQNFDSKTQVYTIATLFLMLLEIHGVNQSEILQTVENMMKKEFREVPEFRGTYDYLWNEINE